jgi:hypothetical protein
MKGWQITLGGTIVMFVVGIVMLLWANSLDIPSTFLGFSDYYLVSNQYVVVFLIGTLFTGFGGGLLVSTLLVYQIETKIDNAQQGKEASKQQQLS